LVHKVKLDTGGRSGWALPSPHDVPGLSSAGRAQRGFVSCRPELGDALQVGGLQTGALRNSRKHLRSDLLTLVKREDEVRESLSNENLMRTCQPGDMPPDSQ
jgi:hypothetical protein